MALKDTTRSKLQSLELPEDREVRTMLENYLNESGYTPSEFADMCGYSLPAISLFRAGRYCANHEAAGNSLALRAAIKETIETHPLPSAEMLGGKIYKKRNYKLLSEAFTNALDHGWAYCVDGPPGTQKTYILETLVQETQRIEAGKNGHGRRAVYIRCRPNITPRDLLVRVAIAAGIPARGTIDQLIRKISVYFATRRCVLVFDEAQYLSDDCIETLRELLDRPPYFGLVFGGTDDLKAKFNNLRMEQWRSRIQRVMDLPGFDVDEATDIANAELPGSSAKKISDLVEKCRVPDPRRGAEANYISARNLFFSIKQIQRLRGKAATA